MQGEDKMGAEQKRKGELHQEIGRFCGFERAATDAPFTKEELEKILGTLKKLGKPSAGLMKALNKVTHWWEGGGCHG